MQPGSRAAKKYADHSPSNSVTARDNSALPPLLILALIGVFNPVSAGGVYRWVDEHGRVQFGDKPPPQGAEPVDVSPGAFSDSHLQERLQKGERLTQVMAEERQRRAGEKRAESEAAAKKRSQCEQAHKRQSDAASASFIYEPSGDANNPRILDDDERQAYERQIQDEIRRYCGKTDAN